MQKAKFTVRARKLFWLANYRWRLFRHEFHTLTNTRKCTRPHTHTHLCKCEYIRTYIHSLIKTKHAHVSLAFPIPLSLFLSDSPWEQSAVRCVFHSAKIFKFSKFCGGSLNIYLVWHWAASTCYVKHFVCFGLFFVFCNRLLSRLLW